MSQMVVDSKTKFQFAVQRKTKHVGGKRIQQLVNSVDHQSVFIFFQKCSQFFNVEYSLINARVVLIRPWLAPPFEYHLKEVQGKWKAFLTF